MDARGRKVSLLLSSSVTALLVGASSAAAACGNSIGTAFDNPAAHTTACVAVTNTSFSGSITNEGTIAPGGINFTSGTIAGSIVSSGTIAGGISLDSMSSIVSLTTSIAITGPTFTGGITNAGRISATGTGIIIGGGCSCVPANISTFAGGVANLGTISAGNSGIFVGGGAFGTGASATIATVTGGIANLGTISAGGPGIFVGVAAFGSAASATLSTFAGGILNSGTITVAGTSAGPFNQDAGIAVGGLAVLGSASVSSFSGGISNANSGTISGAANGIFVGGTAASGGSFKLGSFAGGISNSGTISALGNGILVGGNAFGTGSSVAISGFSGGITNSGTITVAGGGGRQSSGIMVGGSGSFASVTISSFAGGISNSGTISALGNGILVGGNAFGSGSSVAISGFSGGITNSGTITAGKGGGQSSGIMVGGTGSFASVTISSFAGGISNSGTIAVGSGGKKGSSGVSAGIFVGGSGFGFGSGASVTISTFAGGISNSGTISVVQSSKSGLGVGIFVGGTGFGASVTVSTFAGGISNSGTITVADSKGGSQGVGIFVGGSGTGAAASVSTFIGGITNSGTISARTGIVVVGVPTFMGNISNSGRIMAGSSGTGIFVCNCATLAGGAIVNTGTISGGTGIVVHNFSSIGIFDSGTIVGTGGTAIDLTGASGGNTLTLAPGYSITGKVLGFGSDTFQLGGGGSGSFDLSSVGPSQQYQGFTTFNVLSGTWTVSNTFGQSQAWTVNGGATLAGTGTLASLNVNSGGTLEPGTIGVPGTIMTITGNLAFQSGASYLVNISPTAASRANVGGAVSLNGSVLGLLTPGSYSGKTAYDILDPPNISGTFTGFTTNVPGFGGTLTYTPSAVLLNLTAVLGSGGGLNAVQQNVATGINNYFNSGGTLPAGFFPLFSLTGPGLANTLSILDGEAATDAQKGAFDLMTQFLDLLLDSSVDGRSGGPGGMSSFAPAPEAALPPDALALASVHKAPDLVLKAAPPPRWTGWASGFGGYNQTNGDPGIGTNNVIARDYGYAGGMDYHFSPDAVAGFALAGGGTNWGLAQGFGGGRSDAFLAGVHGTVHVGPAYLAGALAFADHWFSTNRTALGDQLTASFDGQSFGARLETGYRQGVPAGTALIGITPYAALQTQVFHTPAYSETDLTAGGLGLSYAAMSATDTRGELGARLDDRTAFNSMPLLLRARLAWAHDWVDNPALAAAFQALPGSSFLVNGARTPANSALASVGGELKITPTWSLATKIDGEFASGSQTYSATGTLRHQW